MKFKIGDRVGRCSPYPELGWHLGTVVEIMDRDEYQYCVSWDTNPIKRRMHQGDDITLVEEPNEILKDIV